MEAEPQILSKFSILTKSREWPAACYDHEVVKNSKEKQVLPCVLYVDGAKTTKRDGVIGFWTHELITMRRCLVAVLAKSEMCRCGCGGWCSIWGIFSMLQWSFSSLAAGVWPSAGHDAVPFALSDGKRSRRRGHEMPFLGALLQIHGDWSEYCSTF